MNDILALLIGIPPLFFIVVLGLAAFRSKRIAACEKEYRAARRRALAVARDRPWSE